MKNRWRRCIVIITLALAMSSPAYAGEVKIATVDRAKVTKDCQAGQKATATLQEYAKVRQKVVASEEAELVKMSEDYSKQAAVLSPEARKDKEAAFDQKRVAFQRRNGELEREVQDKQKELAMIFNQQLENVIKAVAEKEKFSLVLDSSPGAQTLYSNSAIDITDRVIKEMDKVSK